MNPVCDGKKSQSTKFCRNPVCSDKKCQDIHMQPVKPAKESIFMWSVTKSSNRKSVKPASDKNCQAVRYHKKNNPVFDDKICQSNVYSDKNCQDNKMLLCGQ